MRESDGSMGRFTYILHMMTSCLDVPLRRNEGKKCSLPLKSQSKNITHFNFADLSLKEEK